MGTIGGDDRSRTCILDSIVVQILDCQTLCIYKWIRIGGLIDLWIDVPKPLGYKSMLSHLRIEHSDWDQSFSRNHNSVLLEWHFYIKTKRLYKYSIDMRTLHHIGDIIMTIAYAWYIHNLNTVAHVVLYVRMTLGFEDVGKCIGKYAHFRMMGCRNREARKVHFSDVCNGIDRIGEEDSVWGMRCDFDVVKWSSRVEENRWGVECWMPTGNYIVEGYIDLWWRVMKIKRFRLFIHNWPIWVT